MRSPIEYKLEAQINDLKIFIADQAIEIRNLKSVNADHVEEFQNIHSQLVCIGGPLNDNVLQFNKEQRALLHEIDETCKLFLNDED